jgi:predicted DNA-binding WGR domain protein
VHTNHLGDLDGSCLHLNRIRPDQNERRFYKLSIATDLFGNILLRRNWGRIGTSGRVRFDQYCDEEEATIVLRHIARRKRKRGYVHVPLEKYERLHATRAITT